MPRGQYVRKPKQHPNPDSIALPSRGTRTRSASPLGDSITTVQQINERALALGRRTKERKDLRVPLKLTDFLTLLAWAEKYDDDLTEVARACLFHGMEHYDKVMQAEHPYSPFTRGAWNAPSPAKLDPTGTQYPPPPMPNVFRRPPQFQPRMEPVVQGGQFEMPMYREERIPGLPSGATEETATPSRDSAAFVLGPDSAPAYNEDEHQPIAVTEEEPVY